MGIRKGTSERYTVLRYNNNKGIFTSFYTSNILDKVKSAIASELYENPNAKLKVKDNKTGKEIPIKLI